MFRVRWEPTVTQCSNCQGTGKYTYSYNLRDCDACRGEGKIDGEQCFACAGARRVPCESDCRACEGHGRISDTDRDAKQAKVRKALLGLLKRDGYEPVGADGDFELWERRTRVESPPPRRARRKPTAPATFPVLFSAMRFAEMAAAVACAVAGLE